jgi:hypothetical protein
VHDCQAVTAVLGCFAVVGSVLGDGALGEFGEGVRDAGEVWVAVDDFAPDLVATVEDDAEFVGTVGVEVGVGGQLRFPSNRAESIDPVRDAPGSGFGSPL